MDIPIRAFHRLSPKVPHVVLLTSHWPEIGTWRESEVLCSGNKRKRDIGKPQKSLPHLATICLIIEW